MYLKELSLVLSRSYGPGRYDPQYEEEGLDYPIGYVRWTEKRNMEAFLDLLASGAIDVAPFLEHRCPVEQGGVAYQELKSTGAYTVLLEYPGRVLIPMPLATAAAARAARAPSAGDLEWVASAPAVSLAPLSFQLCERPEAWPCSRWPPLRGSHRNPPAGCLALPVPWRPRTCSRTRTRTRYSSCPVTTAMRNTSWPRFPITSRSWWKSRWR